MFVGIFDFQSGEAPAVAAGLAGEGTDQPDGTLFYPNDHEC